MTCSGVCLRRFIRVPFSPMIAGARNSHKGRTELRGSGHLYRDEPQSGFADEFSKLADEVVWAPKSKSGLRASH